MPEPDRSEIHARLRLIEEMMAEGRGATQRWGWMFLLWGVGSLTAMFWESKMPYPALAWPATMAICLFANAAVLRARRRRGEARTTAARALSAIWSSVGITVLLISLAAAFTQALDLRALCVALFALVAVAHSASGAILRWTPQLLAAMVWLSATVAAFLLPTMQLHLLTAAAILLGNVVFGAWLTLQERNHRDE